MNFESVHNYYERMVYDHIGQIRSERRVAGLNDTELEDAACIALNRLPPRYVRHDVDTAFYLSTAELLEMRGRVEEAVQYAVDLIRRNRDRVASV